MILKDIRGEVTGIGGGEGDSNMAGVGVYVGGFLNFGEL